jgi:hypothetical protein
MFGVIGCKLDLEERRYHKIQGINFREVTREEGKKYADSLKGVFAEVSAKTGANISDFFLTMMNAYTGESAEPGNILVRSQDNIDQDRIVHLDYTKMLEVGNNGSTPNGIKLTSDTQKTPGDLPQKKKGCC